MHSSMLREGRRCEVLRDILGHANIDVTQNIFRKSHPNHISHPLVRLTRIAGILCQGGVFALAVFLSPQQQHHDLLSLCADGQQTQPP